MTLNRRLLSVGLAAFVMFACDEGAGPATTPSSCTADTDCLNGQRCDTETGRCVSDASGMNSEDGSAGAAGESGSTGTAGEGGMAAAAGSGGEAGIAGTAGGAGAGGAAGTAGFAGMGAEAGAGGMAGLAGMAGAGGDVPGPDDDGDGVENRFDNCPNVPNADQGDGDGDNAGDLCDADPAVFNYRLSGQLLLVGGMGVDMNHTLKGGASSGAHQSRSENHQLRGRLTP